ncbi:serine threonine kinase [Fusarium circinatum]|uniref:Autophagy-related protein 1 n=1 Tax=Fusarium circinatum TaxID=48490 RepID=A0A8H5SXW9_FUSCI|nr:serine threonine kinase [Fusarium circinatum]
MKFPEGLPQVVALKIPNLHDKSPIASRQKLWTSIFKELQILKHESISSHNSIVKLFGVSWRNTTNGGSFLPVFVLEAAQRGDLATFLKESTGLKLQKGFCLSIDIAAGVQAIHEVGIIHADLKPQNILIFEDDDRELVAKVADFGSAVFLDDITLEVQLDAGTSLWQAPECCRPVRKADLVKTDIYSLGLVIANLMTGNYVVELFQQSEHQIQQNGKLSDSIRADISRRVGQMVQESGIELENGEFVIAARTSALIYWATDIPSQRIPRVNKFHKELRSILNHVLQNQISALCNSDLLEADLDSQEFDILLKPDLGSLSDEDMVQAFKYARLKTQHESSQRGSDISPKYIMTTLHRWRNQRSLGRATPIVSNGKSIFEASKCFGTLRMMPPAVVREIAKQLSNLAYAPSEDSLQFHLGYESSVESALDAMYLSAELGNPEAQGITIWLFEAFGRSLPPEHTCDKTIQWLSTALKYGSETSLRHLKLVSSNVYQIARTRLRTHGGGIGQDRDLSHIWTFIDTGFDMAMSILKEGRSDPNLEMAVYQSAVLSGRVDLMRQVLQVFTRGANHEFQLRESVLLYACRAGYEDMAHFLLDNGADPSKASAEGATPLHFLSSFDDSCMRDIAKKLLSNGALLEARTSNAASHCLVLDSTFGKVNGTPLTWAVAANSQTAVSVLIALGADPFDRLSRKAPVGDRWGTLHHLSPVMPIGSWGDRDTSTLIEVCARYAIPGSLQRILIHGKEHEEAFRKTFELLISAGCDPCKTTKRRHNLWVAAIQWGQPFVVRHLMDWQGGRLRPDNEEWLAYLMTAVGLQDTVTCDVLLEFAKLYSVPESQWAAFFTELVQTTDDSDVLDRFKHHLASNTDHGEAVCQALLHGNFTSARWVYTNARCDIVNAHLDGASCLGKLVLRSKTHSHAAIAVRELLELYELPAQLFENVFELGGSSFTALHLAALHLEYLTGSQMAGSVFQELLEFYNEPDHLNFKIKAGNYKGFTPLHLAVATCNIPAVKLLLAEEDVRINETGPDDKTAMDLALQNFSNQDKDLDLWKVVSHKRQGSDLSHFLQALEIYEELRNAGVTSNKIFAAVVRTDEDNYTILRSGDPDTPVIMFQRK